MRSPLGGKFIGSRWSYRRRFLLHTSVVFSFLLFFSCVAVARLSGKRIANYSIDVQLNPRANSIDGREVLVWHNTTSHNAASLFFHLDPNAFKSDNTAYMTGRGRTISASACGWINIIGIADLRTNTDLTDQIQYVHPDDGDTSDSTVMMVQLPSPVGPGDSIAISIDFNEQLPEAILGRGWAPGSKFYLVSKWFPKIGVFRNGAWNCRQVRALSGSFADFGAYDVKITVPGGYKVGATGEEVGMSPNSNGTLTFHYSTDDVHDFAWTASPDFVSITREFKYPGLPETKVLLLLQRDHRSMARRYLSAVDTAMKYFGLWYGPYPYPVLTVVDLPRTMRGGRSFAENRSEFESPTLIAVGASVYTLKNSLSLEAATIRELGYQYWYGVVANSGFENAWLDKGLDLYSSGRVLEKAYGPRASIFKLGGVYPVYMQPIATVLGVPVASIIGKVWIREPYEKLSRYLRNSKTNAISDYGRRSPGRSASNTLLYEKPDLLLWTLEGVLGKDTMATVLKTYFNEFKFRHPTPADFENECQQMSGRNLAWFFNQFVDGTGTVDFAVKSINYFQETDLGTGASSYYTTVVVARNGEVKMPVEVRLALDDGTAVDTLWNGESRWQSFSFKTSAPPDYAVVDPAGKIPLDTDYSNNSLRLHSYFLPVLKWAGRIFNYFQNMLLNMGTLV